MQGGSAVYKDVSQRSQPCPLTNCLLCLSACHPRSSFDLSSPPLSNDFFFFFFTSLTCTDFSINTLDVVVPNLSTFKCIDDIETMKM